MKDNVVLIICWMLLLFERIVIAICITYAAANFDNPKLLWWYIILLFMGGKISIGGRNGGNGIEV